MSIVDAFDFRHPLDQQTLNTLKSIPGFAKVTKAYMRLVSDRKIHLNNMSSKLLLGPNQVPEVYSLLAPVCERLGIEQPPLYIELDPTPNAYTRGDNLPEITLTSGLLEFATPEEVQVIIAHECGHILCHHVLYHQIGSAIKSGVAGAIGIPIVGDALKFAFLDWMRCSEFSADRAAGLFTGDARKVAQVMMRLSGCSQAFSNSVNLDLFMQQAGSFEEYMGDSGWNKFLGVMSYAESDHPLNAVRANEISKWMASPEVRRVVDDLDSGAFKPPITHFSDQVSVPDKDAINAQVQGRGASAACARCGTLNNPGSGFCKQCGSPLAQHVFCAQCGTQNSAGASFCGGCGNRLAGVSGNTQAQANVMVQRPAKSAGSSTEKIRRSIHNARATAPMT